MPAAFSPSASWHSSSGYYSEAPLISDVFFGRHFNDDGIRLELGGEEGLSVGVEGWRGKSFPATAHESSDTFDAYLKYRLKTNKLETSLGFWGMTADAQQRADERYVEGGGHSHGVVSAPPADVRFTGSTDMLGSWVSALYRVNNHLAAGLNAEFINSEVDGEILDDIPRSANIKGDYQGWVVSPFIEWGVHRFSVRHEGLALNNTVTGVSAAALSSGAGLTKTGEDAERFSAQWRWQFHKHLALRAEAVFDDTMPATLASASAESNNRFNLGVVWAQQLWKKN